MKKRFFYDDIFFEKDGIIIDKTCPICKRILLSDNNICKCGYVSKSAKKEFWKPIIISSSIVTIFFISLFIHLKSSMNNLHIKELDFDKLTPVNVQILSGLKNSRHSKYIQNIYLKYNDRNHVVILIKPSSWNLLKTKEKEEIISQVKKTWVTINKKNDSLNDKKIIVSFANSE